MATVTVVGSINADLVVEVDRHPRPGETLLGSGGEVSAGGKGANQAVACAKLGTQVCMVGAVGTDAYAEEALKYLRTSGVELSDVSAVDGPTGLAVITVDSSGENTIVVVSGANAQVDGGFVDARRGAVEGAEVVVVQGEIPASGFSAAVQLATGRVVVNLAPVIDVERADLLRADPLVANEHEAGLILTQLGELQPPATEEEMAAVLLAQGFASVVITRGAGGAVVGHGDTITPIPAPRVEAIDTTGAGDAFVGALAARLAHGASLIDASAYASRVAALSTTRRGTQSAYPTAADELP
ncbi:ribokinase [Corynebacterium sanguinis]|uniref:ribokinase n=1 Tax=Corynebacterium TaxID=1716 RepID=UPI0011A6DC68|nr:MULTISPECIES: ribokinase [Corynebacterium]MCT2288433.1 ribokinase [Corynebacterium sanguinis]TVS23294.1 ribokinase [Corynebacterium sanguinis]WNI13212.1 ribokinase [Corynebacterium sp. Z-1]